MIAVLRALLDREPPGTPPETSPDAQTGGAQTGGAPTVPAPGSVRPSSPRPALGTPLATARGVRVRSGGRAIVDAVDLDVTAGRLVAVVGPNGAGKSTLLAALCGDARSEGTIRYGDDPVDRLPAPALARRRAVMPQQTTIAFPFTVREVVAMGRAPWQRTDRQPLDDEVVDWALAATGTAELADRAVPTLSGGERALVVLARTLAQDTPVLLLDEPTAALDPPHAARVLRLLAERARAGDGVVVAIHDLTAAAAHADEVVLLAGGRLQAVGAPRAVLTAPALSAAYGHPMDVVAHPVTGAPIVLPGGHHLP